MAGRPATFICCSESPIRNCVPLRSVSVVDSTVIDTRFVETNEQFVAESDVSVSARPMICWTSADVTSEHGTCPDGIAIGGMMMPLGSEIGGMLGKLMPLGRLIGGKVGMVIPLGRLIGGSVGMLIGGIVGGELIVVHALASINVARPATSKRLIETIQPSSSRGPLTTAPLPSPA